MTEKLEKKIRRWQESKERKKNWVTQNVEIIIEKVKEKMKAREKEEC